MQFVTRAQTSKLKYVTAFLVVSVLFFAFDLASDIYERIIARSAPSVLDILHLTFELFSALALIAAIRILVRQLRWLQMRTLEQSRSLGFLRGEMNSFTRHKFEEWKLSPAESEITMYMLKGLSVADIAAARATAEGTVKAQTSSIFRKTGVASRMELMSLFMDEFMDIGARLEPQAEPGDKARADSLA